MVWRGIDESPGFALLADALERRVGQAAANIMRAPFGLSNADELAALVRNAGFHDVVIQPRGWHGSLPVGRKICVELRFWLAVGRPGITGRRSSARGSNRGCSECFREIREQC